MLPFQALASELGSCYLHASGRLFSTTTTARFIVCASGATSLGVVLYHSCCGALLGELQLSVGRR